VSKNDYYIQRNNQTQVVVCEGSVRGNGRVVKEKPDRTTMLQTMVAVAREQPELRFPQPIRVTLSDISSR
jgi:ethanolamine utilization cobalamin adenosyltransferase